MNICFVCSKARGDISVDDRLLKDELTARNFTTHTVFWDDEMYLWNKSHIYLNRCTWDYYLTPEKYSNWLDKIKNENISLYNSPNIIQANLSKEYLLDHPESIPTYIANENDQEHILNLVKSCPSEEVILKPAISASGYHVYKTEKNGNDERLLKIINLLSKLNKKIVIQPYISNIKVLGEYSLIFIGGNFSHVLHKFPSNKDFRVQSHFGGEIVHEDAPSHDLISQAETILNRIPEKTMYARIDGIWDGENFMLSELELNEPYLGFKYYPKSVELFADQLEKELQV